MADSAKKKAITDFKSRSKTENPFEVLVDTISSLSKALSTAKAQITKLTNEVNELQKAIKK